MIFRQLFDSTSSTYTYLLASRHGAEALIIDPVLERVDRYIQLLRELDLRLVKAIDTHLHADHVSGSRRLSGETGVPVSLHGAADVVFPFEKLQDGQKLPLGQVTLEVLHTPGHRPESISLLITNPPRSAQPSMVLTGDCLFVGDVGRP
ncbi:MAG TPA: MBL fold metallo-hydrolase, partial [Candidatus Udaeobacter sp.]|nr:MBL fold metallo-hydrolase [Candidatus Udaeobacter sp.]